MVVMQHLNFSELREKLGGRFRSSIYLDLKADVYAALSGKCVKAPAA
jgi:hypothetical protein